MGFSVNQIITKNNEALLWLSISLPDGNYAIIFFFISLPNPNCTVIISIALPYPNYAVIVSIALRNLNYTILLSVALHGHIIVAINLNHRLQATAGGSDSAIAEEGCGRRKAQTG